LERSIAELSFENYSEPFDIPFPEWTAIWWRWFHSIPSEKNPALDTTGEFCKIFQNNLKVWFLAGTLGGTAVRNCTMPSGRAILFPIITGIFSFVLDPHLKTEEELTTAVINDVDKVEHISLEVDDVTFREFSHFRARSEPFDDIINGMKTRTVSDGYWVFLKPLSIGKHTIHFMGENTSTSCRFFNQVTYNISVTYGC
jgi:hypothetical protein